MNKYFFYLLFVVFFVGKSYSQGEASNWYFGYGAGIRFNPLDGSVSSVDNGQLSTNEGCASMSDSNGLLLFYTDGTTVYNRNHQVMLNGTDLRGDASSTQSAIAVPKPGSDNLYYVFTVDNGLNGTNYGLNYSIIDMSRDNGLGQVTSKNINLLGFCSEKLTAVRKDCTDDSFWVVTLSTANGSQGLYNTYHAFEINLNGVSQNSIRSSFNMGPTGQGIDDSRGYLVLSPDGKKMASANSRSGLFLYDFDNTTGKVSNQLPLEVSSVAGSAYGVAFSPNSQLLYVHSSNDLQNDNNPANQRSVLTQFDLTEANIQASSYVLALQTLYRGGLQLAPDGKIYRAMSSTYRDGLGYLGVINSPNLKGAACNYVNNGINLSPNTSAQGLPPFIQSLFDVQVDIIQNGESSTNLILCEGEEYLLKVDDEYSGAALKWTKDGFPLRNNSNELLVDSSGLYEVFIEMGNGECPLIGEANVLVGKIPKGTNVTLTQCEDETDDGISTFNLNEAKEQITNGDADIFVAYYPTLNDAEQNINSIDPQEYQNTSNPQILYVRVTDIATECYSITDLKLQVSPTNSISIALETCDDELEDGISIFDLDEARVQLLNTLVGDYDIQFYESITDALLENNTLEDDYTNSQEYYDLVYARIENENSCSGIAEVNLIVRSLPQIIDNEDVYYCLNTFPEFKVLQSGVENPNDPGYSYIWSNGNTTESIEINEIGTYSVVVTNEYGCSRERIINVSPSNIASIENITVKDASDNNEIAVIVSGEGDYEYSLNSETGPFQDSNIFKNVPPGLHTVYINDKNGCGFITDVVSVIGFPKFFTPNNDGHNDRWRVYGMSSEFQSESTIYIYDRYGKLLKELSPTGPGWDGTYLGEILPSTDYWFSVLLEDGRLFKGHFALRR